jgi:hypothetical protein
MKTIKHVGILKNTGAKVLVVFRTLPGESDKALVIPTATLPDQYHDPLIGLVESPQAQDTNEFGEIMFTRRFPDGRPMLQAMNQDGRMVKVATDAVLMTPTLNASIPLNELNVLIAEQKNMAVDDLASLVVGGRPPNRTKEEPTTQVSEPAPIVQTAPSQNEPLSDRDLARNFRSQADALYKEAAKLRKQADELDPPQKKIKEKVSESV